MLVCNICCLFYAISQHLCQARHDLDGTRVDVLKKIHVSIETDGTSLLGLNVVERTVLPPISSLFPTEQGGRTVLPPLSSAFPTSRFPGLFFYVVFLEFNALIF
jgi:hypothetical protein